jgi:hypothetical protein
LAVVDTEEDDEDEDVLVRELDVEEEDDVWYCF